MKNIKVQNAQITEGVVRVAEKYQHGNGADGETEFVLDIINQIEEAVLENEWAPYNAIDVLRVLHELEKDIHDLADVPSATGDDSEE